MELKNQKTSQSKKENFFSENIKKLSDTQKRYIAMTFTVVIISVIGGGIVLNQNPNLLNRILGKQEEIQNEEVSQDRPALKTAVENLNKTLTSVSNDTLIYQTIKFEDLPIYPNSWSSKYFTSEEMKNSLIGGASADPDSDGLSNKEEYLYGSEPRNPDTLCGGKKDTPICTGKNDKQNVDAGISPLTGLEIDTPKQIRIKRQDLSIVGQLQDSFETASAEGVDFPTLYQLSRKIDLSTELNEVKILTISNTVESILNYQQFRVGILGDFVNDSELSSFTQIYQLSTPSDFENYIKKYSDISEKLRTNQVPERYSNPHKAYILLIRKIINLVEHRKLGTLTGISIEFKEKSRELATEMVWAYRRLNEELVASTEAGKS